MATEIPVFDTKFVSAWGHGGDITQHVDVAFVPPTEISEALRTAWPTDAHATGYWLNGEQFCPRVSRDVLRVPEVLEALRMHVGFLDLDRPGHAPWGDGDEAQRTVALLANLFPHLAVFSTRAGARMVYILPEPTPVPAFIPLARAILRQAQDIVAAAGLGLEVDETTTQWGRMFRMPDVLRDGVRTGTEPYFALHIPDSFGPMPASSVNVLNAAIAPALSIHEFTPPSETATRPDTPEVTAEEWGEIIAACAERMARRGQDGVLGKLRRGEVFYEPGQRNAATYRAIATLLDVARDTDIALTPEGIYALFAASTKATRGRTPPAEALDELWGMACRLCDAAAYVAEAVHVTLPQKIVETPVGNLPIVVYTSGKSRYLCRPSGRFSEPFSNDDSFRARLRDAYGHHFGGALKMPVVDILAAYGTHVDHVVLDMAAERPSIEDDHRGRHLILPMARRVAVTPEFDADCDAWLRVVAANDLEGVLDWLYWFPHLDRNICSLFLCGSPSTGKSMLGSALAEFYGGEFAAFDKAVGTFTAQLRSTPLVWLDEGATARGASAAFRRLVGNDRHVIERKHVDPEVIHGCYRVYVSANKPSALPMEDVESVEDVHAILQRVRYVHVDDSAADYLKTRGGRAYTEDWVKAADGTPGRLVRHIAWIQANRTPTVSPGARFCVQGIPTPWHFRALYSGAVGTVLALIAEEVILDKPNSAAFYSRDLGQVLVDPVALFVMEKVRRELKDERIEGADARGIVAALCGDDEVSVAGRSWLTLPLELLRGMPNTAFRKAGSATKLRAILPAA